MKVHVTLREEIRRDPAAKLDAYERVLKVSGLRDVNHKRFERYGIITGDLEDEERLQTLKQLAEVSAVEKDGEKLALR